MRAEQAKGPMRTALPEWAFQGPLGVPKTITSWYIVAAVSFIVLGMLAIIEPSMAGLAVPLVVAWLLVFSGIAHLFGAFRGGEAKQIIFQLLTGVVYLIGGIYSLTHPRLALGMLSVPLAAVILVAGALELISYFRLKSEYASGWMLINGIVALVLGGMILLHWPWSTVWAIGILVGADLLITGITRLMFGLAVGRARTH